MTRLRDIFALSIILVATIAEAQIELSDEATVASIVIDCQSGKVIEEHDGNRQMTPASLTKLVTTAAALEKLGAGYKYKTYARLLGDGAIRFIGSGDPTMNSKYFKWHTIQELTEKLLSEISAKGEDRTEYWLQLDNSYITGAPYPSKRLWEDMGNYYGATPVAFNIEDNTNIIKFDSPNEVGKQCAVESHWRKIINNYVKTYAKSSDSVYIYGLEGMTQYASGAMPTGKRDFEVKASMYAPISYTSARIGKCFQDHGKNISQVNQGNINYHHDIKAEVVSESPSVASIAKVTNHESVNLYADALMLELGKNRNGTTSWDEGLAALRQYTERITGKKAHLYDGSGLSPMNTLSPRQIAEVIRHMLNSENAHHYENTLAKAGIDGTLRRLGKGTAIEGRVKGKSGSMTGVIGYAGIIERRNGQKYIFCIIVNHYEETNVEIRSKITEWLTTLL